MTGWIDLSSEERLATLKQGVIETGQTEAILEKDAWACWTLKILFSLPDIADALVFKGGTSLSKAYHVIARFSEDIDLTIDKELLGETSGALEALSTTARERVLAGLTAKTEVFIREDLQTAIKDVFTKSLREPWTLEVDPKDPLSLLFHFPSVLPRTSFRYITPHLKIEFGVRADTWPAEKRAMTSYLFDLFPAIIASDQPFVVPVLSAERTFWEKVTILHAEYHRPEGKPVQLRLARHYYDLFCLATSPIGESAMKNLGLLERVAVHKSLFFRAGWARYHEARPGTLRLVPGESRLAELKVDYERMREMFFETPPEFQEIVDFLRTLEIRMNEGR